MNGIETVVDTVVKTVVETVVETVVDTVVENSSENSIVKTVLENSPHENRSTHFFVLCATTGHHPFGQSNARTQQPSTHDKFFFVVHHIHRDTQLPKHAQKTTEQTSE